MSYIAGVDIGNSTTEVCVGEVTDRGNVTFLTSASCPTTGTKGTIENVYSVKNALKLAMSRIGRETSDIDLVRLNEAAPVIGDTAMETLTETVITDSSMIGHNPSTPAGAGQAVGEILLIENISRASGGTSYILAASAEHSYEEVAAVVNQHDEINIVGIILQADEAVLVENRIRREMDEAFGRGEILLYGEPWSDSASPMEEGSLPCTKNNIAKLDTLIGVFCDNTRDAVRGHVFETKEPGFVNGGTRLEQDIYCSAAAWRFGDKSFVPKAPSQVLTYISAHDNLTLWDKIAATMDPKEGFHTKDIRVRKAYRLAAAVYLMCQGIHFMLSGEEFARTKEGDENSYKSSIEINRLDWRLVQENRDILEYYRGLIALRRELPGVCDLSEQAASRIGYPVLEEGFVSFHVDNAGSEKWEELLIAFNAGERDRTVKLPGGSWELLADGTDSFLWENPHAIQGEYRIKTLEAAVFGRKKK